MSGPEPLGEADRNGTRRHLAVLFSDLSASTKLVGSIDAEDYRDLMRAVRRVAEEVIARHGGTIVQVLGDGVFAVFGYPEAGESDGRCATEAALDLHASVRGLPADTYGAPPLTMHTGVHAGLVLLDDGDAARGRIAILGSPVNIAARLAAAAGSDEVLVSDETLGSEAHFFQMGDARRLSLRGVQELVSARPILGRSSVQTRFAARTRRGLAPFVGRREELKALTVALEGVGSGRGGCVVIHGAAGQGKTRLVEEFLAQAQAAGWVVYRGHCESYLSAEPMQPIVQILRGLGGSGRKRRSAIAAVLDAAIEHVGGAPSVYREPLMRLISRPSSETRPKRTIVDDTFGALRVAFAGLAARRPLIVFIDDWQWADDLTRQAVTALRGLAESPIFIITTTREVEELGLPGALNLSLQPLTSGEADTIIASLLPGQDPFTRAEIGAYADGSPLFIEELCHAAAQAEDGGVHPWRGRPGSGPSGMAWLSALLESRVERLPREVADLARTAAIIGNVVPAWLLEVVSGCGPGHALVRELAANDLVLPDEKPGFLRFKHTIARDVIYEAVGLRRRKALHLRIAQELGEHWSEHGEDEPVEALAYHFAAAGSAQEAARYAELAGDNAAASVALDRAQLQYRAAMVALDQVGSSAQVYGRWIQIARKFASAAVYDPSREQLPFLSRAVALASEQGDAAAAAAAEHWLGYVNYALGDPHAAREHLERSAAVSERLGDAQAWLRAQATLGQVSASACEYDRALKLIDTTTQPRTEDPSRGRRSPGFAYTMACKGAVLGDQGRFPEAYRCFDEGLAAVEGGGHEVEGSVLCWRSGVCLWQGRWEEARSTAEQAQQIAQRIRSLYIYTMSRSLQAYGSWRASSDPNALATLVESTAWLASRGRRLFISLNFGWISDIMAAHRRWPEARLYAARALWRARCGDRLGGGMAFRTLAQAAAAGEARRPPDHYLARAAEVAALRCSPHEAAVNDLLAAELLVDAGDRDAGETLRRSARDAFRRLDMTWHLERVATGTSVP